jgi:hypothetical protein
MNETIELFQEFFKQTVKSAFNKLNLHYFDASLLQKLAKLLAIEEVILMKNPNIIKIILNYWFSETKSNEDMLQLSEVLGDDFLDELEGNKLIISDNNLKSIEELFRFHESFEAKSLHVLRSRMKAKADVSVLNFDNSRSKPIQGGYTASIDMIEYPSRNSLLNLMNWRNYG